MVSKTWSGKWWRSNLLLLVIIMTITVKKIFTISIITFILIVCFCVGVYLLVVKSEQYALALEYIDNNKLIENEMGVLSSRKLAVFGSSTMVGGIDEHAEFKIKVKSKHSAGVVYLEMNKSVGRWNVLEGNLVLNDGRTISLTKVNGE